MSMKTLSCRKLAHLLHPPSRYNDPTPLLVPEITPLRPPGYLDLKAPDC